MIFLSRILSPLLPLIHQVNKADLRAMAMDLLNAYIYQFIKIVIKSNLCTHIIINNPKAAQHIEFLTWYILSGNMVAASTTW